MVRNCRGLCALPAPWTLPLDDMPLPGPGAAQLPSRRRRGWTVGAGRPLGHRPGLRLCQPALGMRRETVSTIGAGETRAAGERAALASNQSRRAGVTLFLIGTAAPPPSDKAFLSPLMKRRSSSAAASSHLASSRRLAEYDSRALAALAIKTSSPFGSPLGALRGLMTVV